MLSRGGPICRRRRLLFCRHDDQFRRRPLLHDHRREVGLDVVWDTMIAPVIVQERAAAELIVVAAEKQAPAAADRSTAA